MRSRRNLLIRVLALVVPLLLMLAEPAAATNRPPVADPGGPYTGVVGSPILFDASASFDPDGDEIVDYLWDFGDLSTGLGVTATHSYSSPGTYVVTLIVSDGVATASATTSAVVTDAPAARVDLQDGTLAFNGAADDDIVVIVGTGQEIAVRDFRAPAGDDKLHSFPTSAIDRVVVNLGDGDDVLIALNLPAPVFAMAGEGDDLVAARGVRVVATGGAGSDLLVGGQFRDILIGGTGADRVDGFGGGDVLIGGSTSYDNDVDALDAIRSVWDSETDYATRVDAIRSGVSASGVRLARDVTVTGDGDADLLSGSAEPDWFLLTSEDSVIPPPKAGEVID